jgi:hypothetical protein
MDLLRTSLELLPSLARTSPELFAPRLPDVIRMLRDIVSDTRTRVRAAGFVAQAGLVLALGAELIRSHAPVMLATLREALLKGVRSRFFCVEVAISSSSVVITSHQ